jgi:RNA polymerase sigma factor (sigma-70 family)
MEKALAAAGLEVNALESAFAELLASYGPSLRRIARSYAGGSGEDEDLHQEILCQLWRSWPSFRGDAAAGTWLYRVALNTALTHRRQSKRRPLVASSGDIDDSRQAASVGEPKDEAAILREFLGSLGAVDRSAMILYMEGLAHQGIADVLGLSLGAVGVRIHRLKQAFKQRYVER